MVTAYVALGANLGDAAATLRQAIASLNAVPDCSVKKTSSLYKTAPLETLPGHDAGGDYINAVVEVETSLPAPTLLQHLQHIEHAAGRQRPYTNAPRTLDLDLLLYGSGSIHSATLVVPHPRMWQRAFCWYRWLRLRRGWLVIRPWKPFSTKKSPFLMPI